MSKDLFLKQLAHIGIDDWLKFVGTAFVILAIAPICYTKTGHAQTGSETKQSPQSPLQVQGDTTESGFSGGITSNDFVPLMDLIQSVIASDSWQDNGGEGALIDYPAGVYVDAASTPHWRRIGGRIG